MNLVVMQNRTAVTSSLVVAESFEKEHKHVLRDIENIKISQSKLGLPNMFFESTYENRGKQYKMYYMNRDGFTMLVGNFTGEKAMLFRYQYTQAFNEMERQLIEMNLPSYEIEDHIQRATKWIEERKELIEAEKKIELLTHSGKLYTATELGGELGISAQKLNAFLVLKDIQWKVNGTWVFKGEYKGKGYTSTKQTIKNEKPYYNMMFTELGRQFVIDEFMKENNNMQISFI